MVTIGACVKEPGSSRNNKTGSWRTFKPILDKEKCIDSENCVLSALKDALTRIMT